MSLVLDDRRRAMLAEMGVRLFEAPSAPPAVAPAASAVSLAPIPPAPEARPQPAPSESPAARRVPVPQDPARAAAIEAMSWDELEQAVAGCEACGLCASRRNTVFGVGDRQADWLIVGEAPGENEDLQGEPFVGQAGKLLDNMLRSLGLDRGNKVYIANVLKCRPPGNRNPDPQEVAQCEPYLRRQVQLLQPRIILAMGRFAVQALLGSDEPIGKLRGRRHEYMGIPLVVTYHPAYLLRNLPDKARAWADLCLALELMRGNAAA
ncbi:uracil-DNA glycosylase [Caenimonas aquaedulcis]|uniref:Type-4 uracil-DNA glycosylase n=1 Tax=Caenimonas aquaedulcis TaxID=2793270 RepID=A0A931MHG2_9BURK|nr:uracil-DNA glycosylase [Caenimonas aquaedulcis]MBG9388818.1 uracil-DNA glycosylase [Caenimonas aquaedulcis]